MIDSKLKLYFKTHLPPPSIDFDWKTVDNVNLFSFIQEQCPNADIQSDEVKLKIKQAFKEYIEPVGYILLTNKNNIIKIKVFPYKIKPEDSVNLDYVIEILEDNEHLIEYDYNGKEDLISINKTLKDSLFEFVNNIKNEEINRKELVKYAIREAFELSQRDIVIIKSDQIIIKLLDELYMNEVPDSEKDTVANRFNGINEDELESFYNDVFIKNSDEDFFYFVAEIFVDIHLVTNKTDNQTYEKIVFPVIQSIITEQLVNDFDHNDEFFKGFSGYIFRKHFKEVFGYIAELILAELSVGNTYIYEFLKYYSLDVVVFNGQKYKVPAIEAQNGLKWSVASMMSIVKIYMRADMALIKLEEDMEELNSEIKELSISGMSPVSYNIELNKQIDKIKQDISHSARKLDECLTALTNNDSDSANKNEIRDIRHRMKFLNEDKDRLENQKVHGDIISKYNDLKRDLDTMVRQETREKNVIEKNSESFGIIKDALAKALISKKKLIK